MIDIDISMMGKSPFFFSRFSPFHLGLRLRGIDHLFIFLLACYALRFRYSHITLLNFQNFEEKHEQAPKTRSSEMVCNVALLLLASRFVLSFFPFKICESAAFQAKC